MSPERPTFDALFRKLRPQFLHYQKRGISDLLVALSGGSDSVALTALSVALASRLGMTVHTLTVDHGLRSESLDEAKDVLAWARSIGALAQMVTVSVEGNQGPEGNARNARRSALAEHARLIQKDSVGGICPILLGHTMDDQAETVLLRLARGAGNSSLKAMAACVREDTLEWHRPLLGQRRADLRRALTESGIGWVEDPTNAVDGPWRAADDSPLRRSAIRHHAIPALASALGMDPTEALARTAQRAYDDEEALIQWAQREYTALVGGESVRDLSLIGIYALPRAILSRVLRMWLIDNGARPGDLSAEHIERAISLVNNYTGQGTIQMPGIVVTRVGKKKEARLEARSFLRTEN